MSGRITFDYVPQLPLFSCYVETEARWIQTHLATLECGYLIQVLAEHIDPSHLKI